MGDLRIDHLTKTFGDAGSTIVAVDDLDIEIEDGEFVVLVGPSGCGKSTTLRCVGGLESLTEGDIVLDGEVITDRQPMDRNMAMVFQSYALYPHMTARENMAFGLKMTTDLSDDEIDASVEGVARTMGIEDLLDDRPGELSGGQQQRVALGRAIVREPEVFLMDEPLSNLDAKLRTEMRTELQELQQRLDVTTIYVTHDQTEAMTMGDRIAVLDAGELQQIGTPMECYHKPKNQFVASFIGSPSMNFFETYLAEGTLEHDAFDYQLSPETARQAGATESETVTLGIRPEDILVDDGGPNTIDVTVNVAEPLGETTFVHFDLGDVACTATVPGTLVVEEGDELTLRFPEERVHLFDGRTGEAIKNREFSAEDEAEWGITA